MTERVLPVAAKDKKADGKAGGDEKQMSPIPLLSSQSSGLGGLERSSSMLSMRGAQRMNVMSGGVMRVRLTKQAANDELVSAHSTLLSSQPALRPAPDRRWWWWWWW